MKEKQTLRREIWAGDNLEMFASLSSDEVAMVYMDPPFASNRAYDAILSNGRHEGSERIAAFDDRWILGGKDQESLMGVIRAHSTNLADYLDFIARSCGTEIYNYLMMMVPRILESRRVLSPTGSIYLHCDPSASHYLKVVLDLVFGQENFRNEIIWKRTHAHSSSRRFGPVHDTILYYSVGTEYTWNPAFTAYDPSYLEKHFRQEDERGRFQLITCTAPGDRTGTRAHYEWNGQFPPPGRHWAWKIERMREMEAAGLIVHSVNGVPRMKRYVGDGPGVALQDVWIDIKRLDAHSEERVGYDTQKPVALLTRMIEASTVPGDLVVDPFSGTGTTAVAAENTGRSWVASDSSLLATSFTLARTRQEAGSGAIKLTGFPDSLSSAESLLRTDAQTFGIWGTSMLATLTSRKSFSMSVASGAGKIRSGQRQIELRSWVPLVFAGQALLPKPMVRRRLPELGLVLRTGRSSAALRRALRNDMPALPIREVRLETLVNKESRSSGLSNGIDKLVADIT